MFCSTVVMQSFTVTVSSPEVIRDNNALLKCVAPSFVKDFITVTSWLQDSGLNIYPSTDGDGKVHMMPSGELLVMAVNAEDAFSRFECRVTHRLSGATYTTVFSAEAGITVVEPSGVQSPRFSERALSVQARREQMFVLPCVAQGHPPPTYTWEFADAEMVDDETRYMSSSGALVLVRARPSHSGRYSCLARNAAGAARLDATVEVVAPLSVRVTPQLLLAGLNKPAQLSCQITGHPVRSVTWLKDGQPLAEHTEELHFHSVGRDDQGMYQCFVRNDDDVAQGTSELRLGDTPPQFVYRFIRQTIQPGQPISLKCVASGNPTPNIKWALDGFPLPHNERNRFVIGQYVPSHGDVISHVNITSVRVEDGGTYRCLAVNRVGEVEHNAQLNVYGPPHVREMGEISAIAGETLRVDCPAAGYPLENITWHRGDRQLPYNRRQLVFPNGSLIIEKVQSAEDDGPYKCVATNKQGYVSSGIAKINVMVPPKITPFSFRSDVHLGERVGVQCVVSKGDAPLQIQWLKDDSEIGHNSAIKGVLVRHLDQFTSVLSIAELDQSHDGNYTCVASNTAARASHSAPLSVNVPPAITPFSFGELSTGERVRVTCSVKRGDPPLTFEWLKDAHPLPPTPGLHDDPDLTIRDYEDYSSVLAISSVSSRHSGNYTCEVRNPARVTTYTAQLLVTVPPTWVVEPKDTSAKLGQSVIIDCKVDGFPQPTVSWKKASGSKPGHYLDLAHQHRKESKLLKVNSNPEPVQVLANGSLFIETISQDDEGHYLCEASNNISVGLSAVVQLTVHAPVRFKSRSHREMVRKSGTAVLRCEATGDLPITLSWRKEGSPIEMQSHMSMKNITSNKGLTSELTIQHVRSGDGGIYSCLALNEYGHDQTTIHLLIQDLPSQPTNVHVLGQDSRKISIAWNPPDDGNSPITRYVLQYNPTQVSWQGPSQEMTVDGKQNSAVVSQLHPATLYSIRVVAENNLGPGAPSQEMLARTEEEAPTAPPRHVTIDAVSSTQLMLTWDAPPEDHLNGMLLGHYVGFRQIGESEGKVHYNYTTVPWKGYGKEEYHLESLKKYSKYGVVVQAFNSRGPGPLSEEVVAQTLEDVPEAAPRDVRCTALSSESLQVSWQPPPESLVHGVIQGYRLIYEPVSPSQQQDIDETRTKMTPTLTTVLHGLFKFTNYSVQILAFTRVGDGVKSPKVFCMTKEDVPGAPAGIKALLQAPDTAVVTWLPPTHPNGIIVKYVIYIRIVDNGHQVDARSALHLSMSDLRFTLPGVKRRLRYEFWVTAFTKIGEGQSTPVASVTPESKVRAGIISFGGPRMVTWKSDVRLPCQAVGIPEPKRRWLEAGDVPLNQHPRINFAPDGSLLLSKVQRTDQGEYTCHVSNEYGEDTIVYQLLVQVPPSAPLLIVPTASHDTLHLQWKLGDNGGSPVRGFIVHFKLEHGEWEEIKLDASQNTHALTNLRCGTLYHVFITAYNRVGSGDPSKTLAVRTRGERPHLPSPYDVLVINSTSVGLRLATWPDGGCPILYFVVEYSNYVPRGSDNWITVGNNIGLEKLFLIVGLSPGTTYNLKVTAHNSAGSNVGNYQFTTLSINGGVNTPNQILVNGDEQLPLHKDLKVILLSVFSALVVIASIFGVCFCVRKKAREHSEPETSIPEIQTTVAQDNKHNIARREQYYATVRKLPPSPAGLECIPEYSEDIRPYATFHVATPVNTESTKMQTFVYREGDASPTRKSMRSEYCRVKKPRPSEEYDSFGSESDTEPGTSSRTESSNQLDDGGMVAAYHPPLPRLVKPSLDPMYPHQDWSSTTEASPGSDRRHFQRRICQAHHLK
ncbi:Down syndrome cell adhesion molecule-like protein Dscam2 [Schistocerca cancellata]|uniref:Down syndrome cell adhesion molecule-like protein Dscam2 n=1 Tax=Schistocerca cancellata TaxID=274614 RepID=UPI002117C5D0|nr:Down syndrome cell adhesion molecule-like protein Dscam2 [Schistocerca cancellata]